MVDNPQQVEHPNQAEHRRRSTEGRLSRRLRAFFILLTRRRFRRPGWVDIVVCGFLPGALAGAQIAGLLFFLNSDLPFGRWNIVLPILTYASALGTGSLLIQLPFTWGKPQRARSLLPWGLTLALALAGILDFTHASHFAQYLLPGIKIRLLKAGSLLSLAALVAFYTALLHTLQRRRYGLRSALGFAFLAIASVYVMVERREAFKPRFERVRSSALRSDLARPKMLVVGVEGATLDAILPLAEEGRLPFFGKVLREGAVARLESFKPYRRAALWTSLATGKFPHHHGIADEEVLDADNFGLGATLRLLPAGIAFRSWGALGNEARPVQRRDREALALWQILSRLGYPSGVIGWPVTAPTASELNLSLSERFFTGPVRKGNAHPAEIEERARLFRVGIGEVDPVVLARFGKEAPYPVQEALARDAWRQSISVYLLEHQTTLKGSFVMLPGLRVVSERYFGGYASAAVEDGRSPGRFEDAAEWIATYYEFVDAVLQELWEQQGDEPGLLAIVSPAGVDRLRGVRGGLRWLSDRHALRGSSNGSPDGVFLLYGEGVRTGERLTGVRVTDVVPTLLYALRYPLARDMDGKVLTQAFEPQMLSRHPLSFVPSYEALPRSGLK